MGKIGDRFVNWIRRKYEKKGIEWNKSDDICWGFWGYVFPIIIFIPILFLLLKKLMIDYLLEQKGFHEMVAYAIIIVIIKPLVFELFTKLSSLKDKAKE